MKLTFLGATGTVTGSKYLLDSDNKRILIDCGLFQGLKELRLRNWGNFPVNPKNIDAMVLTHAHLDHSGYIPRLVKDGFKGPIYCSEATLDLCKILLPDSGHIQEEDAESANRHNYTRHSPALPLYTEKEARECIKYFKPVPFGQPQHLTRELSFTLHRAGHILGASFIRIAHESGESILFSGDLGRLHDPVIKSPAIIQSADYLVVESTYGDRLHDTTDPMKYLETVIKETAARGGTVILPAFAVGRAQNLMYYLHQLKVQNRIPEIPIYLDSPMAMNVSDLLCKYPNDHRLPRGLCEDMCKVAIYTRKPEESKAINRNPMPKVIISASGMATGGRVLHHLKHYIDDRRNTVILPGFQAAGTRGDKLARGETEIKIHGQWIPVRAQIVQMHSMSAHADYGEILTWLENFTSPPRKTFIVHGEPTAAQSLKVKIQDKFDWNVTVPEYLDKEEL